MTNPQEKPASPLLQADDAILSCKGEKDGKLRISYRNWEQTLVLLPGEHLEVVNRNGQVNAFRRGTPRTPDPDAYEVWDGT